MAEYIVVFGYCVGNGVDVYPGDIVEMTEQEAQHKLIAGQIKRPPKVKEVAEVPVEPKRKKRGGKNA